jgi:GDP-L-fucose synthase
VTLWGTGSPRREFLHVDDLAEACLYLMREYEGTEHVNIGTGTDLTIRELAEQIQQLAAPDTKLQWDSSKPDGMPQKLLDISRIKELGWSPRISLEEGLKATFDWFQKNYTEVIEPRTSKKEPV